jgi:hypothetical protein
MEATVGCCWCVNSHRVGTEHGCSTLLTARQFCISMTTRFGVIEGIQGCDVQVTSGLGEVRCYGRVRDGKGTKLSHYTPQRRWEGGIAPTHYPSRH